MYPFSNKRVIFVLLLLMWAELSLVPFFSIRGVKPDFLFIFLAFYAFKVEWKRLIRVAFVVGMLRDLMTNSFFGLETAAFVGSALALQFFAIQFDREKKWIQMVSLFIFSYFNLILFFSLNIFVAGHYQPIDWFWIKVFFISLYTTGVGFLLFPFLERWLQPVLYDKQYELF